MALTNLNEDFITNILENLSENTHDLYNCIQLNHSWSKIGVSILWRYYPWKNTFYSKKFWKPISHTILLSLPIPIKELIIFKDITKSYIINNHPMYNYISYCRILSQNLILKISNGILSENNFHNYFNQNILIEELWKLFLNNLPKIDYFILPNNLSLINFFEDDKYIKNFQNIVKLECTTRISQEIFNELSKISNNITELIIYIYFNYPNYDNIGLAKLISSQENLKWIKFISYDYEKCSNLSNLSNSLNSLTNTLISIEFKEEDISSLIINNSLINLKHLSIDLGKENTFIGKNMISLNSIELPSLEVLEITLFEINLFDSFITLLKQSNSKLKKIKIETNYIKDDSFITNYINTIIEYCPLIEDLNLWVTNNELKDIELLLTSCIKLNQLLLETRINEDENNEILEAKPFFELLSTRGLNNLKEINLIGKWNFNNEELENFLVNYDEEYKEGGLKIGFHCVNGDDKEKFENICQIFEEKGTLKKYEFNYR
ncbi:hypothetical protein RhiirA4_414512 [Rhizophagus irregularis]|uniref:F-box domain-containing protein n=1 Tax=Rhizophagus irregularis TaxID=588596 RepID=A0A2I1FWW6_9GLOM|nr:hypothetical protein RhiirA4_414512 [Rhizophagus irregularis]